MKILWCWRCKAEMPMLDENEYAEIHRLLSEGMLAARAYRQRWQLPLKGDSLKIRMRPLLEAYERMTGMKETNQNAIMHHRLSIYGPPCKHCGRPLRTPNAKLCGSCMAPVLTDS